MKNNIVDEIDKIIDWYGSLPINYENVEQLMNKRQKLSTLFATFTTSAGKAKQSLRTVEISEEENITHLRSELNNELPTKACILATYHNLDKSESVENARALSRCYSANIIGIKEVLSCMGQHISLLRTEKLIAQ